jgi:hypothetical protein
VPIVECGFPAESNPVNSLAAIGPTLLVEVGFDPAHFDPDLLKSTQLPPQPVPSVQVLALIDTGAQQSCIDELLAQQQNFPMVDQAIFSGISGPTILNVYLASVTIPGLVTQVGRFSGVQLQAGGKPHRVLIGRTLLKNSLLFYDGSSGTVKLAR